MHTPKFQINEIYKSVQGEGTYTGVPMVIVRFQGCNLQCSFCDTGKSLAVDGGTEMELHDIVRDVPRIGGAVRRVMFTGGEPLVQQVCEFACELHYMGYRLHLETNGTFPVPCGFDFVTVSPKIDQMMPLHQAVASADEIKWLVRSEGDLHALDHFICDYDRHLHADFRSIIWLQPVSCDERATRLAYETAVRYGYNLSVQTHKLIGVA